MKYYWSAREPRSVEPGFRVPGWDPSRGDANLKRVEAIWEEVRKTEFSDRPSRLGAVFVCRRLDGFCNPKGLFVKPPWGGGVYEVSVQGKTFLANSEYFTEAREDAKHGDWDSVRGWGKQYWAAEYPPMDILEEVVVQGTVTVKHTVEPESRRGGSPPISPVTVRITPVLSTLSPDRIADAYLSRTASRTKTAGEVRFIKDRGGDKNEWAWGTPGPSNREIGEDFAFKVKCLKPLTITLRATLMAMGHAISAQNTFAKIKSADVSPDGNLGGKGYIQKVSDMRRAYMNVVEALSALSDTLHDEIKAPHWNPEALDGGSRERDEVKDILADVEEVELDPEAWAEGEEESVEAEDEEDSVETEEDSGEDGSGNLGEAPSDDEIVEDEANPSVGIMASTHHSRSKKAALRVASLYMHTSGAQR